MLRLVSILLVALACLSFPTLALAPDDCGTESSGIVPVNDPFGGVFVCEGPCGEGDPQPECAPYWFETSEASGVFIGYCRCDDGTPPEPSPCCHLVLTANLGSPPSLVPSVSGQCGGPCPGTGECQLGYYAIFKWNAETQMFELVGYRYTSECIG